MASELDRFLNQKMATTFASVPPLGKPLSLDLPDINPAKWMYERLVKRIIAFEKELSPIEEIGARLVATPGPDSVLQVEDVSYWGPNMIMFIGTNEHGRKVELIQHYTQLSLLLTALPTQRDEPRRIGYLLEQHIKEDEPKE